jgi:hypothetical protein
MSNGFVKALLLTQQQVFGGISPSQKITPPGYLKMLMRNGAPNIVTTTMDDGTGHVRDVVIKYRPRVPLGKSGTVDDCSVQAMPAYLEQTIPALSFRKYGVFLDYQTIAKYETEASTTVNVGRPAPPQGILLEIWKIILEAANGLFGDIDSDLIALQAASFGKNVTTGLNTAKTINFPLSTVTNPLTQGLTMLMDDVMQNEIRPNNFSIVGSGLINNAYLQQQLNTAHTADANWPAGLPEYFWDPYTAAGFAANEFGVFEKGAVKFVNVNKFNGFIGGDKMSTFLFTLTLPITDGLGDSLSGFKFDVQLRHVDCPEELEIAGTPTSVGRGWILDIMSNYTQFNLPSDAYTATDRLTANNGTLLYTATNA